jgi:chondroitin AC lyase
VGREISRKGKTGKGMATACRNMAQIDSDRRFQYEAFARRILGKAQPRDLLLSGNRQFWCSDIMTHTRPGYYTSVRMCSTRIDNTDDPCNSEGLLSHHIADGATFIFKTGREYYDIFGVWDWLKIPGATIEQKPLAGSPRHRGTKSFVGGVSDGQVGLAAYDFALDDLAARKSWFYFDDEFVCLGAGITCPSGNPVYTSINQCLLEGDVLVSAGGRNEVAARGRHALKHVQWIHHHGVGYLFIDPQEVMLENDTRQGSWWRINKKYPKDEVRLDVFSLWLDHGKSPEDGTYAYIVSPAVKPGGMKEYAASVPVKVLCNSADLQAVKHSKDGCLGAAFFQPGSLETDRGFRLSVNQPCLVMLRRIENGYYLAVSNPRNEAMAVDVEINRRLEGAGSTWSEDREVSSVGFEFLEGPSAGRSLVRKIEFAGEQGGM